MEISQSNIAEFIGRYYEPVSDELMELREFAEERYIPVIRRETENFFNVLFSVYKPSSILEIGTAIGYSSMYFALKCPDASIFTIERDEKVFAVAEKNISDLGLKDRISMFLGDGEEITNRLSKENKRFDLVFIDAAKSHYKRFVDSAMSAAKSGALIISDDIFQRGTTINEEIDPTRKHRTNIRRMQEYVEYITSHPSLETMMLNVGDGLAVSRYTGNKL